MVVRRPCAPWRAVTRCVALTLAVVALPALHALNGQRRADSYSIQGWLTEHGMPSNKVRAITQTRDGYLWMATAQGLARFDGNSFTVFSGTTHPVLRGGGFFAVLEAPDGALWFGGEHGLFRWRDGRMERFTTAQGLPHNYVRALALTRYGTVVAGTRGGFSFVRGDHITLPGEAWKEVTGVARSYLERADGTQLLGTDDGWWRVTSGKVERLSGAGGVRGNAFASIIESGDGTVFVGYSGGLLRLRPDGTSRNFGVADGFANARVIDLKLDQEGNLWIATAGGLYRLKGDWLEAANYLEQLGGSTIQQLHEDREGGMWVATSTGLFRLKDNVSTTIGMAEGLAQTSVFSVLETRDHAWWIGIWNGGLYRYEQGRAVRVPVPAQALDQVFALAEHPDGTLWVGTTTGLYRRVGETFTNVYVREQAAGWQKQIAAQRDVVLPGLAHNRVNAVAFDGRGTMWAATDGAVYRDTGAGFRAYTMADGLPGNIFKSVLCASNGDVWVTAPPQGVARWRDGQWTAFRCGQEIPAIYPRKVLEDSAGAIWVTTEGGGLHRFKQERWRTFTTADGLADDFISGMTEDGIGNWWIAGPRGITRVPRAEFDELDTGDRQALEPRIFNRRDGLPAGEVNQQGMPNAWRTQDGRVLFATDRGVAVIQPSEVKLHVGKPPVYIERIVVNGVDTGPARPLVVPPGQNDVQLHYTAVSLLAPEKVRFRIRLDPLDDDWVETGARRDVRYAKLPAGDYVFRVRACNADGTWSEDGAAVAFTVRPFFYQTKWFVALVTLAVVGAVFGIGWTRARLGRRQMALLAALVDERTRELQLAKERAEEAVRAKSEMIDELHRAQEETAHEKARLQFIFESVPVGISFRRTAPDGKATRVINEAHLRICGITREQLEEPKIFERISHPDDYRRQTELVYQQLEGLIDRFTLEKRYVRPDGETAWVVYSNLRREFPDGSYEHLTTVVDITATKQAQEEAARDRARFKFIFDAVPVGISWYVPGDAATHLVNPAHERITGVSAEQSRTPGAFQRVSHPDDYRRQQELTAKFVRGEIDHYSVEKRYLRPDGGVLWAVLTSRMFTDPATGLQQSVTTLVDINERKEAEAKLAETHQQLLDTSRRAGMAEVATGVLHNVGNVLTSVNVSTTVLSDAVRQSKIDRVAKLAGLLESTTDLARFFAEDPRGKKVPEFLRSLATHLGSEQGELLKELESLRKNVEHIKDIVAMQQSYAKVCGVIEPVAVTELVEDALRMNAGAMLRHDVDVVCDYAVRPVVTVDKHKVLQILVNLLRNAKYACDEAGRADKRVIIRVTAADGRVRIAVSDNGVGIPAENLTRIFAHGFTTRRDGHGFGLHSGALAAKELGGALTVESAGAGQGATFILELPEQEAAATAHEAVTAAVG